MGSEREQLKQRYLRALARQYQRKGYRVVANSDHAARPAFLADFTPSLLAFGADENVVVDVEFREDLIGNDRFLALVAAIEAAPGWRFDLVITSPRELPVAGKEAKELSMGDVRERIADARQLLASGQEEAAFLLASSAVEATLRLLARDNAIDLDRPQSVTLLSQLIWEGLIDQDDYTPLRQAVRYRNMIVHGYHTPEALGDVVDQLIAWVEDHYAVTAHSAAK